MAGDFLHLDIATIAQWPNSSSTYLASRGWFPVYCATLSVFSSAIVFTRIYLQLRKRSVGFVAEYTLVITGWIFGVVLAVVCTLGTQHYGFDRHIWDVPPILYNSAALIQWLSQGAFILSTCFTKISVLCCLRRLNYPYSTSFMRIIYGSVLFIACNTFADVLVLTFQCQPVSSSWTVPDSASTISRSCINKSNYYIVNGLLTSFTTVYTIIMPGLVLSRVPMTKLQRIGLRCVLVGSFCVIGAGIARTVALHRLATSPNGDATWNGFNVFLFANLEAQLGLLFASLPFIHRLLPSHLNPFGQRNTASLTPLPLREPSPEPAFEFPTSPPGTIRPSIEMTYERYTQGAFGPPVPPKDLGGWLEMYRRDHGEITRGSALDA
ncbi:hypothetical protein BDW02DRAFT_319281 [Decorospora gaudefroyi]|uniref:Rhodopsin domain-containing protein n=1 Tax=Decorospora gaudefroyi TaxID=184978 RepID=A0A6A5KBW3_9PLEO|nr:hypothetical protein BDW02DRAFT_319281 [Decorospora gaudefroyi]